MKIVFRTKVKERDKVVLSNAAVELFKEVPKKAEKAAAQAAIAGVTAAPAGAAADITSADVFVGIEDHIQRHPEIVSAVERRSRSSCRLPIARGRST